MSPQQTSVPKPTCLNDRIMSTLLIVLPLSVVGIILVGNVLMYPIALLIVLMWGAVYKDCRGQEPYPALSAAIVKRVENHATRKLPIVPKNEEGQHDSIRLAKRDDHHNRAG